MKEKLYPTHNLKTYLPAIILALLYFLAGKASLDLLSGDKIVTIGLFASEGIALAFALYYGKKVLPGIFIGQFFLTISNEINLFSSFEIAIVNSLEALIAIVIFQRFKLNKELKTFKDAIALFLIILFVLQPFSAIFSNTSLLFHGDILEENFLTSSFSWWFGNIMGQFLFTPFILLLLIKYKEINFKEYLLYGLIFTLFLYILSIVLVITNPFLLLSLTLPLSLMIVSKKGTAYGLLISICVAFVASYSVYIGIGAFYVGSVIDNAINYNLFVLAHITIILTVGILFDERKEYANTLQDKINIEVEKNKEQQLLLLQQNRLAQMGEMISMIAHQWRQPLNSLALINQLIIVKYSRNKLDDKTMEYFKEKSTKQISNMSETIDDFRNFYKTDKEKKEFSINDAVMNPIELTQPICKDLNIEVNFTSKNTYSMIGQSNILSHAILNIINNAKDAFIDKEIDNKKITIVIEEDESKIIIAIQDNAGGIPENIIDKIFDPYFSTKEEKNGTGLGLYMSKIIIQEELNAQIRVTNENSGALFKIFIQKDKS